MERRLGIHAVTPDTKKGWVSKVQIVDMYGGIARDKQLQYLNMIFQDEKGDQVKGTVYADLIPGYLKILKLYHTYLVAGATVQLPTMRNETPVHTYDWILTGKSVVEDVTEGETPGEEPLPAPTKLIVTPFHRISHKVTEHLQHEHADIKSLEYDILAVVVNCFPPRYVASAHKTLQEVGLMDINKRAFLLTIWEADMIKNEGSKILEKFKEYPIFLGRRIGVGKFGGLSLIARFNSTIQLNPPYPQTAELRAWATRNQQMLESFTQRSTSEYGTFINVRVDEEVISIADIPSEAEGHVFSIEAKISLPEETEYLHVLICSKCGLELNVLLMKKVRCMKCQHQGILSLRCRFDANLTDRTGSTTGMFMDREGEKLLDLTAEEIYDKTKNGVLPTDKIQSRLLTKTYRIEAKKSTTHVSEGKPAKLYILSCTEKEDISLSLPLQNMPHTPKSSKRKTDRLFSSDEGTSIAGSETKLHRIMPPAQLEPSTPVKKI